MPETLTPPPVKTEAVTPTSAPVTKPTSTPAHVEASPESDPDFAAFEKQLKEHDSETEPKTEAPKETPKETPKEVPKEAPKPVTKEAPKELRARKEQLDGEVTTLNAKIKELESKITEGELKGKDVTTLNERLVAREKELEDRDKVIRALKREQDPKFKEKWDAPFEQAAETARRSIERLPIVNEDGTTRPATFKEFIPFYRAAVAEGGIIDFDGLKTKFGDGFPVALSHLNALIEKNDQRERALADENKRWEGELKEAEANEVRQREEMTNLRSKAYKYVEDSHPEWFKENAEDTEHTELLNKGRAFVAKQPKTPGEAALLQAEIFHRASAHDLVLHKYEKLKAELETIKAENEELKSSGPGTTRRDSGGGTKASSGDEWEETKREMREAANS